MLVVEQVLLHQVAVLVVVLVVCVPFLLYTLMYKITPFSVVLEVQVALNKHKLVFLVIHQRLLILRALFSVNRLVVVMEAPQVAHHLIMMLMVILVELVDLVVVVTTVVLPWLLRVMLEVIHLLKEILVVLVMVVDLDMVAALMGILDLLVPLQTLLLVEVVEEECLILE